MKRAALAVSLLVLFSSSLFAQRKDPVFVRDAIDAKSYPAAPRLAEHAMTVAATSLPSAETSVPEEIVAIREWNEAGRVPARNGFTRALPDVVELKGAMLAKTGVAGRGVAARTDHGTSVWSTVIQVEKAHRLRLHLENCVLPEGAVLWVYGAGQAPIAFGRELLDDHASLWTPITDGDTVWLDVETPSGVPTSLTLREVMEIVRVGNVQAEDSPTCLIDSSCVNSSTFDVITLARRAVAQLEFVKGSGHFICSGGLINGDGSTPYLLTANHCFSSQAEASSLDAYFDYFTSSCNGSSSRFGSPSVHGATLLASSATSDFTFVRLNSLPSGRVLLGWDARTINNGTKLYRLSHPQPDTLRPQQYSSTLLSTTALTCTGYSRPNFLYSTASEGGTYGGSSGSPVMLAGGYVVGQLFGACGPDAESGCDARNRAMDGALSVTYDSIKQWIDSSPAAGCIQSSTSICLSGDRFAVSATYQAGSQSGDAKAVRLTSDTGYFWFFGPDNVEVVIKVINACGLNSRFWVFAGGLTNVKVVLTVRDTKTGTVKTYNNAADTAFQPIQDTNAFATCP
jgi:V8-like Glu-specific endopeptidase